MVIYIVYAFCAGQKFDASTISGLIIILYPVAKWILVKAFLTKIQTRWIKMIKKIYFSETTIFASQGLRFGLRRCETTEPLKKGKLAGIFPELTSVILFPIGNPRWSSTKHEHIKKDPMKKCLCISSEKNNLLSPHGTWMIIGWVIVVQCQVRYFSGISLWDSYIQMRCWCCLLCTRPTQVEFVIVLVHWNNSLHVDLSLHVDTLFWFRANQSLLLPLNDACSAEKLAIPI